MIPEIVQVIPMDDYKVNVYFDDGKIVCYDAAGLIEKGAFAVLKDIQIFKDTCTILNDTLAWDIGGNRDVTACLDIDPYMLYELEEVDDKIA